MPRVRTQISFKGFTESEVRDGLPSLASLFRERYWLLEARGEWDRNRRCLVITVERVGSNPAVFPEPSEEHFDEIHRDGGANWDEINECVDACFHQSAEEIIVHLDKSELISDN